MNKITLIAILITGIFTTKASVIDLNSISINDTLTISNDIVLIKITDDTYIHVSYLNTEKWGRIGANGLLLVQNSEACLFDSPWNDAQTETLYQWLLDSAGVKVTCFIPNHWHEDCMGGLAYLQKQSVKSYANQMTLDIAKEKGLPVPDEGFTDSLIMVFGEQTIECYYPGAAHSIDNITIYLPQLKILFAGCPIKCLAATNLGNTSDGDIKAYPETIKWIAKKFTDAKIVIPGHGNYGGPELIKHTLELAQ